MPFGLDDAAFGAIIGAGVQGLFSAGGSMASTAMANRGNMAMTTHQAKLQDKYNKEYARWSATELPSLNREGMTKAGFNPILAYSQGTGEQGHVNVSSPGYNAPDFSGSVNSAFRTYLDAKEVASRIDLNNAQKNKLFWETADMPMLNIARRNMWTENANSAYYRSKLYKWQAEHPDKYGFHMGPFRFDSQVPYLPNAFYDGVSSAVDRFYEWAFKKKESEMSRIENDGLY